MPRRREVRNLYSGPPLRNSRYKGPCRREPGFRGSGHREFSVIDFLGRLQLAGLGSQTYAQVYRLDASAPDVQYEGFLQVNAGELRLSLPAESISLIRVEAR